MEQSTLNRIIEAERQRAAESERQRKANFDREARDRERAARRFVIACFAGTLAIVAGIGFILHRNAVRDTEAHDRFMRQCMEDHKEYECTALWRIGDRPAPDIIPLPIIIPK